MKSITLFRTPVTLSSGRVVKIAATRVGIRVALQFGWGEAGPTLREPTQEEMAEAEVVGKEILQRTLPGPARLEEAHNSGWMGETPPNKIVQEIVDFLKGGDPDAD
jgi:hypothetical protein